MSWWREVFFNGIGSAFIGGLFAVLVASLTVRWTKRADREAARLEVSRQAAVKLTEALLTLSPSLKDPNNAPDLTDWNAAVALHLPVVVDLRLAQRVTDLSQASFDWAYFLEAVPDYIQKPETVATRDAAKSWRGAWVAYRTALGAHHSFVGQSLAAHRIGQPLPVEADLTPLPTLPGITDK